VIYLRGGVHLLGEPSEWVGFGEADCEVLEERHISLGQEVRLGVGVRIGNHVRIGDQVILGEGVCILEGVVIHSCSEVGKGTKVGERVFVSHNVSIGDGVRVGANAMINAGARIGRDVHIPKLMRVGSGGLIPDFAKPKFLHIVGTCDSVSYWGEDRIDIGCLSYTIQEWVEKGEKIGRERCYSAVQIKEYMRYIAIIKEMHEGF